MLQSLAPQEDFRHPLRPGEHEAFYFAFTARDGRTFGILRTLFGPDSVLEMMVLRSGETTWVYQFTGGRSETASEANASGERVSLQCVEPWKAWRCAFHGPVQDATGREVTLNLGLDFTATTPPGYYLFGPYTQAHQDGRLRGFIRIGAVEHRGEWLCYRDHSWGVRPMGVAMGWTLAWVPECLYAVRVETFQGPAGFGRFVAPDGSWRPLRVPRVALLEAAAAPPPGDFPWWRMEEPEAGLAPWVFARLAAPLVGYLGPAGHEAFRSAPQPDDLLQDELGPARFVSPEGQSCIGFLEQARRLS